MRKLTFTEKVVGFFGALITVIMSFFIITSHLWTTGATLQQSDAGYNSKTLVQNYYDLVNNALDPKFNTTKTFSCSGVTCLGTPELTSSSSCTLNDFQITYLDGATPSATTYEIRTDVFSEIGLVLSLSNNETKFDQWYNSQANLPKCAGSLLCWVSKNVNGVVTAKTADTAIDGDVRAALALYQASNNTQFSNGNRTKYRLLANTIIADVYRYDTATVTAKITTSGQTITRLPFSGKNCAQNGLSCGGPHIFNGYLGDTIKAFQIAYAQTGNVTYAGAVNNFTAATLSINVMQNTGTAFGVACKSGNYITTHAFLNMTCGEAYDYDDAPRFEFSFCDSLRVANITGTYGGIFTSVALYCQTWANSGTYSATAACIPYNPVGTCGSGQDGGVLGNSYSMGMVTYYNQSYARGKLDAIFSSNYNWGTKVFESSACGNGFTFRTTKAAKALAIIIGLDEASMGAGGTSTLPTDARIDGVNSIILIAPLNNTNTSSINVTLNVTVFNNNVVGNTTNSTGLYTLASCNMTSVADSCGATGGTLNTTDNTYNSLANFQFWTFGPFNQTQRSWFNITGYYYFPNASNDKFYPEENTGSTDTSPHIILDMDSNNLRLREEPGYSQSIVAKNNTWQRFSIVVNRTAQTMTLYNSTSSWSVPITYLNNVTADYYRVALGGEQSLVKVTNMTFVVLGSEVVVNTTSASNTTVNVSFYAGNNTLLYNVSGVSNGTNVSFVWRNLILGNYPWYVTARSEAGLVTLANLTFYMNNTPNNATPTLTSIAVNTFTNSTAFVTWTTSVLSNSSVQYGTTVNLGSFSRFNDSNTSHIVIVSGLLNNTLYYYNVTSCNPIGNSCNTSGPRNFTTLSNAVPNGTVPNITSISTQVVELGTLINISSSSNVSLCLDIDAYGYGVNYTCGASPRNLTLNVSVFVRTTLNTTEASKNITFGSNGVSNKTIYLSANSKDDVKNLTLYLRGFYTNNTFPTNVVLYVNNTLVARIGLILNTTLTTLNAFNDTTTSKKLNYPVAGTTTAGYVRLPKNAAVTYATMTFQGISNFTLQETATATGASDSNSDIYFNYTKSSSSSNDTLWQVKYYHTSTGTVTENLTFTNSCWQASSTQVQLRISNGGSAITYDCKNETGDWSTLRTVGSGGSCVDSAFCQSPSKYVSVGVNYDSNYLSGGTYNGNAQRWCIDGCSSAAFSYEEAVFFNIAPANPWMEIGTVTGSRNWNYSGTLSATVVSNNFSAKINTYLATCTADSSGYCTLPVYVSSSGGSINVSNLSINYTFNVNPVIVSKTILQAYLRRSNGTVQVPLTFQNEQNGTIEVSNISYQYVGGNSTISITSHSFDGTKTNTTNITYVASQWNYSFSRNIYALEFIPPTPFSQNVSAYGQSSTKPTLNITNIGYGWTSFNLSIAVNSTYSCVNLSIGGTGNITLATRSTGQWIYTATNLVPGQTSGIWLYASYNCNNTGWRTWKPSLSIRACATNSTCSDEK